MKRKYPKRQDSGTRGTKGAEPDGKYSLHGYDPRIMRAKKEPDPESSQPELEIAEADTPKIGSYSSEDEGYYDPEEGITIDGTDRKGELPPYVSSDQGRGPLDEGINGPSEWMFKRPLR